MSPAKKTRSSDQGLSRDDAKKIVGWVTEQYGRIKNQRAQIERQWYYNMAFYFGRQYVAFRSAGNTVLGPGSGLYTPKAPPWRARPVINKIRPIIRKEMSKLLAQKPTAYIIPNSSDEEDIFAANAGEQIWESIYQRLKIRATMRKAAWWNSICGSGFLKCYWDEEAVDDESMSQGDIQVIHVTPFHLFLPDFREEELENQPYIIQAQLKSVDAARLMYPEAKLSSTKSANEIIDNTWLNLNGVSGDNDQGYVLCLEAWIKPNQVSLFPEGAVITVIADQLVQYFPGWPYMHGKFPYAKIDHVPSGKLYGDSVITDLISLQKEYNRRRGQIQEAANRMSKPVYMAERGAVDPSKITSEPGLVIEYAVGHQPPVPVPPVNLPQYLFSEMDRMGQDMMDISAQHEISRGQVPPNVEAATAISFLQEQDDTMLAHTYESVEEAMEKIAKLALNYIQQFWDYERTVKVTGIDGSFDAMAFKGSMLKGNTDIRIEAGSSLPTSRAARQAYVLDLIKLGIIEPNKGLEVMEIGGIQKIYENIQIDVRQAQRENIKMAGMTPELMQQFMQAQQLELQTNPEKYIDPQSGEPRVPVSPTGEPRPPLIVPVNNWDNHAMHVEVHNNYRKSQQFENADESVKELFNMHVMMHVEQLAIKNMATMATGIPPDKEMTGPPPGGAPPGPAPGPESEILNE